MVHFASASLVALLLATAAHAEPRARIEGVTDEDLRRRLETAVGEVEGEPGSRFEARRRANEAAERAVALLRSEGYYGHRVEPTIGEGEAPPRPVLRIDPGPRFTYQAPAVAFSGAAPAPDAAAAANASLGLTVGEPGRAEPIVEAEGRAVAALQSRGYADAKAQPRQVVVDHADASVQPTFQIASGELVRLNGIDFEQIGRTDPEWLRSLAPWRSGEVYEPNDVAELERRLLDTGVYDSVTVSLAPQSRPTDGLRPVIVSLADRPRRTLEALASVSTSEGVSVEGRRSNFNRFGRADTLTYLVRLGTLDSRLESTLSLPHYRRPQRTLTLGGAAFATQTEAFDETGVNLRADITQRFGRTTYFTYGASVDLSQTAEFGEERNFIALTGLGAFNLDRSSDPLDPRSGYRVEGRVEPTALTGDSSLAFLRTVAQGSIYLPFGENRQTVIATRVRLGLIAGGQIPEVPASRRFYAGGGGSVRGYEFQAVGPRAPDGKPFGGLSLAETSLELRRSGLLGQRLGGRLSGVVFVDAGSVGLEETPSFDELKAAVGFGVRYNLGFGPLRADLAVPLNKEEGEAPFQIYLSIGQAFDRAVHIGGDAPREG
ncbi:MAG: autotransporter assembly complex protein TamA [Proteobacteria bacterium]|nr:autotransporter assembly complex protein TamA [Pseudomonadota bacterium]